MVDNLRLPSRNQLLTHKGASVGYLWKLSREADPLVREQGNTQRTTFVERLQSSVNVTSFSMLQFSQARVMPQYPLFKVCRRREPLSKSVTTPRSFTGSSIASSKSSASNGTFHSLTCASEA